MFHDATAWGWPEAPPRPLIGSRDLPKRTNRLPRFIPAEQLGRLMAAIRSLECPYQRAALIIARWSGARRGEISRLELECLDNYLDGTPRLRVPSGKTATERMVPLHPEAAEAIRELQALARPARGFRDECSGLEAPWLFVLRGHRLSSHYLFESALQTACERAGLLDNCQPFLATGGGFEFGIVGGFHRKTHLCRKTGDSRNMDLVSDEAVPEGANPSVRWI